MNNMKTKVEFRYTFCFFGEQRGHALEMIRSYTLFDISDMMI